MVTARYRPTQIEVQLSAIEKNVRAIKGNLPDAVEIMAVVKADAYGHGAVAIARKALEAGATRLSVAVLDEALQLREAGIDAPILILGYTPADGLPVAQRERIACTFYREEQVEEALEVLDESLPPLAVHLKVDTGMHRIGFTDETSFLRASKMIANASCLRLEGLFTHFATADEEDSRYTHMQMERFKSYRQLLEQEGIPVELVHVDNSAGALHYPMWGFSMVRLGIAMYGYYPSAYAKSIRKVELIPALSLKSAIVHLKDVPKDAKISYGGTYTTKNVSRIATVPLGYGDGFPRRLSNIGHALVHGVRVPIVGRICMDQLMLDVTAVPQVSLGDEVIFIGKQGEEVITADDLANLCNTISYEILTQLGTRLPRIYVE